MVSSKVGHDQLPNFLEAKVSWKTRITQSRSGSGCAHPQTKKEGLFKHCSMTIMQCKCPSEVKMCSQPWSPRFQHSQAGQQTAALWEWPLVMSFLPVSPTGNTSAEQLLLNAQVTARTESKLVPTDPKQCQGSLLPSAASPNVRKRWDRRKVCQEVCTCTAYSPMLLFTVVPKMGHTPKTLLLNEEKGISVSFYNHCSTDLGCSLPVSAQTGCIFRPKEKRIWPKMLKGYFKECFSLSPFSLSLHLFVLELIPGKKNVTRKQNT